MERLDKYEIVRPLGRGATSEVFLANDLFGARQVAIKVFHPELIGDPQRRHQYQKLFLTEASLAGRLSHPHIVAIYDAVADEEHTYIVMEYVAGSTLERCCEVDNLLPLDGAIEIAYKCCKALEHAFRNGIIHRDIKPANILLKADGGIKITDFGSALVEHGTQTTQVVAIGSPAYMSPEQVKEQPLSHQTDIYSLGVVMYKLLTGRLPFEASNNHGMIYQIINTEPLPPSAYRPEVPEALDAIVLRALQKDPAQRHATWAEFAEELVQVFAAVEPAHDTISDTEKFDALRNLGFFQRFSDVELWEVLRITEWSKFSAGTVIIREGDRGDSFFVLARGEVKVTKQDKLLTILKGGDCFGEMAYLAKARQFLRSASVVAVGDVIAVEVKAELLARASEACRRQFDGAFLDILVDRLAMANTRLSQLLAERNVTIY